MEGFISVPVIIKMTAVEFESVLEMQQLINNEIHYSVLLSLIHVILFQRFFNC